MKSISDDPRFTAWLLGELPEEEAAEISRLVASDPALTLKAHSEQKYHQQLSQILAQNEPVLHPLQREKILQASRSTQVPEILTNQNSSPRSHSGWWISAATAAAIILGIYFQNKQPTGQETDSIAREIALLPIDGGLVPIDPDDKTLISQVGGNANVLITPPTNKNGSSPDNFLQRIATEINASSLPQAAELPQQSLRNFVTSAAHPRSLLPLQAGDASWKWISRSITEKNTLPWPSMIRMQEMINAFPRPDLPILSASAASSPLQPSRQWVFVRIHNSQAEAQNAQLTFIAPEQAKYRLIGFRSERSINTAATQRIPAKTQTTLLLEIEATQIADLGSLQLTMNGKTENLLLQRTTPDTQHRHLACIAAFGLLLGGKLLDPAYQKVDTTMLLNEISSLESQISTPRLQSSLAVIRKGISLITSQ